VGDFNLKRRSWVVWDTHFEGREAPSTLKSSRRKQDAGGRQTTWKERQLYKVYSSCLAAEEPTVKRKEKRFDDARKKGDREGEGRGALLKLLEAAAEHVKRKSKHNN